MKLKPQLALLNFESGVVVDKILLSMKSTSRRFENMEGLILTKCQLKKKVLFLSGPKLEGGGGNGPLTPYFRGPCINEGER